MRGDENDMQEGRDADSGRLSKGKVVKEILQWKKQSVRRETASVGAI